MCAQDGDDLEGTLKQAGEVLGELRATLLTPKVGSAVAAAARRSLHNPWVHQSP
jgi:hypothetical protein